MRCLRIIKSAPRKPTCGGGEVRRAPGLTRSNRKQIRIHSCVCCWTVRSRRAQPLTMFLRDGDKIRAARLEPDYRLMWRRERESAGPEVLTSNSLHDATNFAESSTTADFDVEYSREPPVFQLISVRRYATRVFVWRMAVRRARLYTTRSNFRGSSRGFLRFCKQFCRRRDKLQFSRGRSRKIYVLNAVNTVHSRSSRYVCG